MDTSIAEVSRTNSEDVNKIMHSEVRQDHNRPVESASKKTVSLKDVRSVRFTVDFIEHSRSLSGKSVLVCDESANTSGFHAHVPNAYSAESNTGLDLNILIISTAAGSLVTTSD